MVNDWKLVATAKPDGTQCEIRIRDRFGPVDLPGPYFYHDDGHWYLIEPPMQVSAKVTHYREINT